MLSWEITISRNFWNTEQRCCQYYDSSSKVVHFLLPDYYRFAGGDWFAAVSVPRAFCWSLAKLTDVLFFVRCWVCMRSNSALVALLGFDGYFPLIAVAGCWIDRKEFVQRECSLQKFLLKKRSCLFEKFFDMPLFVGNCLGAFSVRLVLSFLDPVSFFLDLCRSCWAPTCNGRSPNISFTSFSPPLAGLLQKIIGFLQMHLRGLFLLICFQRRSAFTRCWGSSW